MTRRIEFLVPPLDHLLLCLLQRLTTLMRVCAVLESGMEIAAARRSVQSACAGGAQATSISIKRQRPCLKLVHKMHWEAVCVLARMEVHLADQVVHKLLVQADVVLARAQHHGNAPLPQPTRRRRPVATTHSRTTLRHCPAARNRVLECLRGQKIDRQV